MLRFLIMVFVSMAIWIVIGLGGGFLLHGLIPAIDLGMGTLIGVVALGGCFLWLSRLSTLETLYSYDDIEEVDASWSTRPPTEARSTRRKRRRR